MLTPKTEKLRQNVTLPSHRVGILLCMWTITIFFIIFTTFILLVFFYFFSLCLVFFILFLLFIALFDWFSLFSLYCILIFLLSLHVCSSNTQLLIVYCHSAYPNHIFLVILLLFQCYCK